MRNGCSINFQSTRNYLIIFVNDPPLPRRRHWHKTCTKKIRVTYYDIIIIYLACGSPVGVHRFTQGESEPLVERLAICLASVIFWPLFVLWFAIGMRKPLQDGAEPIATDDEYLARIERAAFLQIETQALFDLREVFHRFAGLARASFEQSGSDGFRAFYAIIGHPDPVTASKCRARTNQRKIERNLISVRLEFIQSLRAICRSAAEPTVAATAAIEFAEQCDSITGAQIVRSSLHSFLSSTDLTNSGAALAEIPTVASGLKKAA